MKNSPGEYYHLLNRGVRKQNIFHDRYDWARFTFLILYLQSLVSFEHPGRHVKKFVRHSMFGIDSMDINEIVGKRYVELTAFTLMPNHFHLLVKEVEEGGIAKYMQRVLNAYTKYYNTKYKKSGHLFQGSYKSVRILDNTQLLHISSYIHRNPRELTEWKGREIDYPWSSYKDTVEKSRWGELLVAGILIEQFANKLDYKNFVETSTAKLNQEEISSLET